MNEKIFRKKSIERMETPEELNDYIRISEPGIWLLIAALILLLIGALVWGSNVMMF